MKPPIYIGLSDARNELAAIGVELSERQRERLRSALLGYAEKHGIGVPTLQVRIADATDRSPDLLPLKTLQRFLTGIGRTNDSFLIPCFQFAQSLPAANDTGDVARELAAFFGVAGVPGVPDQVGQTKIIAGRLHGRYSVGTSPAPTGSSKIRVLEPGDDQGFSLAYSNCIFESSGSDRSLRIREEVFNPGMIATARPLEGEAIRHRFEGVVLLFDPLVFIVSKNVLTRLPRAYWLREFEDGVLAGYGMEAAFLADTNIARPYTEPVDFEFRRLRDEPKS